MQASGMHAYNFGIIYVHSLINYTIINLNCRPVAASPAPVASQPLAHAYTIPLPITQELFIYIYCHCIAYSDMGKLLLQSWDGESVDSSWNNLFKDVAIYLNKKYNSYY